MTVTKEVIEHLLEIMRQNSMNFGSVAERAGLHPKTVQRFFRGEVQPRDNTYVQICDALGEDHKALRVSITSGTQAAPTFGGYRRSDVRHIEGYYKAYRRRFKDSSGLLQTVFALHWSSDGKPGLRFNEVHVYNDGRSQDYSQAGEVYLNAASATIQLLSDCKGDLRLISLKQHDDVLRGAILTAWDRLDGRKIAVAPIYMRRFRNIEPKSDLSEQSLKREFAKMVMLIANDSQEGRSLDKELRLVTTDVVHFV